MPRAVPAEWFHIASYAKWVNLGFNEGASLGDPLGMPVGTGAHIRHVRFAVIGDLEAAWLDGYVRAALDNAGCRADMGDGGTTVRVSTGPKRPSGGAALISTDVQGDCEERGGGQ
jgi:hypothetical protein